MAGRRRSSLMIKKWNVSLRAASRKLYRKIGKKTYKFQINQVRRRRRRDRGRG